MRRGRTIHIPIETDDEPTPPDGNDPEPMPVGEESETMSEKKRGKHQPAEDQVRNDGSSGERPDIPSIEPAAGQPAASAEEMSAEELLDLLRRTQAEFANYRRRTERERLETGNWVRGMLVESLLPVIDDLDRAAGAVEDPNSAVAQGFLMVREKMMRILTEAGLERIHAEGEEFDPNLHEALLTEPVEGDRAGKVLEELVSGYMFKGRVIRPTRVKVGMESAAE
jgi:molecular chaperone GrpE